MKYYLLVLAVLCSLEALCQKKKHAVEVGFHGFVGVDAVVDTRASKVSRNRHIYLYPLNKKDGDAGEDLNRRGEMDIDAAHSRFGVDIKGPELNGITTTAMIEADFEGESSGNSYFRLRHAFVRFTRKGWSLLAGQSWHPLFIPENSTGTLNCNAGAPFRPLNRSPQLQLSWMASPSMQLLLFLVDQNNFRSSGFSKGSEASMVPEVDLQAKWQAGGCWAAFTGGIKTLAIPRHMHPVLRPAKVTSTHFNASFRYRFPSFSYRMGATYGGNISEMVMLGGVGKTVQGHYKPLHTGALWVALQGGQKKGWQPGFFAGVTQNLGAASPVVVIEDLSRESKISSIYAISPRVKYIFEHVVAGVEWLWTTAAWGQSLDGFGVPKETTSFANHRILGSLRYYF